jgi:carbon-monoxide dehydrogenase iron sulfur subunit
MYELKVSVTKVMGACTANPPMKPGDYFTVKDGDIQVPEGGYICAWALHSLIPVLTPKEREIAEQKDADWMWRVKHVQCPDPAGRVVFQIEQVETVDPAEEKGQRGKGEVVAPGRRRAAS